LADRILFKLGPIIDEPLVHRLHAHYQRYGVPELNRERIRAVKRAMRARPVIVLTHSDDDMCCELDVRRDQLAAEIGGDEVFCHRKRFPVLLACVRRHWASRGPR